MEKEIDRPMNAQQTLFTIPERQADTPLKRRRDAMKAAMRKAGEPFREAFRAFVLEYLQNGPADGETIRAAYLATRLPRPQSGWQSVGGIYARLRREGLIQEVGKKRSEVWGNDLSVIALVKSNG